MIDSQIRQLRTPGLAPAGTVTSETLRRSRIASPDGMPLPADPAAPDAPPAPVEPPAPDEPPVGIAPPLPEAPAAPAPATPADWPPSASVPEAPAPPLPLVPAPGAPAVLCDRAASPPLQAVTKPNAMLRTHALGRIGTSSLTNRLAQPQCVSNLLTRMGSRPRPGLG